MYQLSIPPTSMLTNSRAAGDPQPLPDAFSRSISLQLPVKHGMPRAFTSYRLRNCTHPMADWTSVRHQLESQGRRISKLETNRRRKGAIKLHLLLDHDGYLPSFAGVASLAN